MSSAWSSRAANGIIRRESAQHPSVSPWSFLENWRGVVLVILRRRTKRPFVAACLRTGEAKQLVQTEAASRRGLILALCLNGGFPCLAGSNRKLHLHSR